MKYFAPHIDSCKIEIIKGILALLEQEKIFNGVVVTALAVKDNTTLVGDPILDQQQQQKTQSQQKNLQDQNEHNNESTGGLSIKIPVRGCFKKLPTVCLTFYCEIDTLFLLVLRIASD